MSDARVPRELRPEILTTDTDPLWRWSGFLMEPRDETLRGLGGRLGVVEYMRLARDGHTGAALRKRRRKAIARDWEVRPASDEPVDVRAADLVRAALDSTEFDKACYGLLNCLLTGYQPAEVVWQARRIRELGGDFIVPAAIKPKDPRRVAFAPDGRIRLMMADAGYEGIPAPPRKILVARHGGEEIEDPYGLGLGHDLWWPVFFKKNWLAWWAVYGERFAQPTPAALAPQGADDGQMGKMLKALLALSNQNAVVIPNGWELKLLEAARSGSSDYESAARFWNAEISKIILGGTLGTDVGDSGSRALGEVHQDAEDDLVDADCDLQSGTLNATLCTWITELNYPDAQPPTVWRIAPEEKQLDAALARDLKVKSLVGYAPSADYVRDQYGEHWAPPGPALPGAAPAFAETEAERDLIDGAVEALLADWAPQMGPAVQQVLDAAAAATSYEEFLARVTELTGTLDLERLRADLAATATMARIAGRAGVPLADGAADD